MSRLILYVKMLSLTAFIFSMSSVSAQNIKQEFLQRFEMKNKNIASIQSEFIQKRTLSIMDEALVSSGKFYYKKPGLIKWDQELPSPYYFILNGKKVLKYDGKKRQVINANSPQVSYFKDFILGTVNGSMLKSEQFTSSFTKEDNEVIVILIPQHKSLKKRIEKIQLIFEYEKMILMELVILEKDGDETAIFFSNQQFNTISNNVLFN